MYRPSSNELLARGCNKAKIKIKMNPKRNGE